VPQPTCDRAHASTERRQLTRVDVAAGRQARALVRLDLGDAPVLLVGHQGEVAGLARDPARDGQREVDRRRRGLGLDELRPDEGDVIGAELAPGQRRVIGERQTSRATARRRLIAVAWLAALVSPSR